MLYFIQQTFVGLDMLNQSSSKSHGS